MRIDELRDAIVDVVSTYFRDAMVVWEGQRKAVRTGKNCVTLSLRSIESAQHYIRTATDGEYTDYQPSTARLTVQLFSHGATVQEKDGAGNAYSYSVNTALNDLAELDHFLISEEGLKLMDKYDMAMERSGILNDASAIADTNYEYRAIQEYEVYFTQHMKGMAGESEGQKIPTASGGGVENEKILDIESVEIDKNFK